MKTKILSSIVAAGLLAGSPLLVTGEHQINFKELPQAVQQTINNTRGPAEVAHVGRTSHQGIPIYNVRLQERGAVRDIYVTETGTLVDPANLAAAQPPGVIGRPPHSLGATPQAGEAERPHVAEGKPIQERPYLAEATKVDFEQMPQVVQNTVRSFVDPQRIEDIDRGRVYGRIAYEVGFKHEGQHVELLLAEDGSLIRDAENERFLAKVGRMPAGWGNGAAQRPQLVGAQRVNFNQIPEAVQNTVRYYSAGERVTGLNRGTVNGQTVYEASFQFRGQPMQLRLREDGWLMDDPINQRFLAQFRRQQTPPAGVGSAPRSWDGGRSWDGTQGTSPNPRQR
jgi:hypothetical protein